MVVGAVGGLYVLAFLACPISMGLMMWFMARGMGGKKRPAPAEPDRQERPLAELKAEQARLAARMESLERESADQIEKPKATRAG